MNPAEAEVLRHVAAELREIADQLELRVVAQAAERLTKKLQKSSFKVRSIVPIPLTVRYVRLCWKTINVYQCLEKCLLSLMCFMAGMI